MDGWMSPAASSAEAMRPPAPRAHAPEYVKTPEYVNTGWPVL